MEVLKTLSFGIALVVIGAIFVLLGLSGGFSFANYSLEIQETWSRVVASLVGAILVGVGILVEVKSRSFLEKSAAIGTKRQPRESVALQADIKLESRNVFAGTMEEVLKGARSCDMLGLTLLGSVTHSLGCFEKMAADPHCRLRLIIVKPGSAAMDAAVGFVSDREQRAQDIRGTTARLQKLLRKSNVHLRFTSVAPPFSLLIIDSGRSRGRVQVELYGLRIAPDQRPHFLLARNKQPWYNFFIQQFEEFWEEAQTLEEIEKEMGVESAKP